MKTYTWTTNGHAVFEAATAQKLRRSALESLNKQFRDYLCLWEVG